MSAIGRGSSCEMTLVACPCHGFRMLMWNTFKPVPLAARLGEMPLYPCTTGLYRVHCSVALRDGNRAGRGLGEALKPEMKTRPGSGLDLGGNQHPPPT